LSLEAGSRRKTAGCATTLRRLLRGEDKSYQEQKNHVAQWDHEQTKQFIDL